MRRAIKIYDTTLRDGTQGEGVSFSMEDRVRLAARFDAIGIHYIEGGWPGSNPKDLRFFRRMQDVSLKHAKLCAFSMTRRAGVSAAGDANMQSLIEAGAPVATIVGKSWDFHVTQALETTLPENLAMIGDTIAYLRPKMDEVMYDAEHFFDGFRANPEYALATLKAAADAGAHWIVLDVRKRILLLVGPPGCGKSTLVNTIKQGLEDYTRTRQGAVYAIKGCPVYEGPLHLIPRHRRKQLRNVHIEGDLCPYCRWLARHAYRRHLPRR